MDACLNEEIKVGRLGALAKIEAELMKGAREYFEREDFIEIFVPHITRATGSCENMDTVFGLRYFEKRAYLMQTGQLFLEILVPFLGRVWCAGPSFRKESRANNRHLTEFTLIEMECRGNLRQLMRHIENLVRNMIDRVGENCCDELKVLGAKEIVVPKAPFQRITYTEAVSMLGVKWGRDLKSDDERHLLKLFGEEPVFVTHHPKHIKFFNMKTNEKNKKVVNSVDLILPHCGEAVGGAEREFDAKKVYAKLVESRMLKQLKRKGGSIEDFRWYLNHLKRGSVAHAGCGIGLSRITQYVLGVGDIRSSTVFPLNKDVLF
jgi:asparaginyl-tRNA synthetase